MSATCACTRLQLGVVLGLVAGSYDVTWLATGLDTLGGVFVGLLKAAVPPLVFTAIVVNIANLRQVANAARLATQTLLWFMITSLIAVAIGIGFGLLTSPGRAADVVTDGATYDGGTGSWLDFLTGLVPQNFLGLSISDGVPSFSVLQIVVVALVIGAAALKAGEKAEPFLGFMRAALAVIQQVLWWIILLAPIGTLGLIGRAVATYDWDLVAPLATFTFDVYLGCAIVLLVVYPLIARFHGLSPSKYFSGAWPAIQLAFVSRSSVGTMPLTQRVTTRNLGVPMEYASFAVPFGATTKMDGCAAIVAKREGILDVDAYNAPRGADLLGDDEEPALQPAAV